MKKFFETPEVNSVELTETDVIMNSYIAEPINSAKYTPGTSSAKADFDIWKGINK